MMSARGIRLLVFGVIAYAATMSLAHSEATKEAIGPCPWDPKQECVTISVKELAKRTAVVWRLRAENERLKAQRRFGCAVGVGLGVSGVVTSEWDVKIVPATSLGVTCGVTF